MCALVHACAHIGWHTGNRYVFIHVDLHTRTHAPAYADSHIHTKFLLVILLNIVPFILLHQICKFFYFVCLYFVPDWAYPLAIIV